MRASRASICVACLVGLAPGALLTGCHQQPGETQTAAQPQAASSAAEQRDEPADPAFIGRVWISTTPGTARGSILVFLPDRTVLMDSCFETFRVSQWGVVGDHIRWIEDTIPIEAKVTMVGKDEMRLEAPGHVKSFVAAPVPYVCPDMPR
jgi:hypothetical protein